MWDLGVLALLYEPVMQRRGCSVLPRGFSCSVLTSPLKSPSRTGPWKKHPRTRPAATPPDAKFWSPVEVDTRTRDQSEDQLPWSSSARTWKVHVLHVYLA